MRAFRIFGRNIIESFKGVFRNFSLSIASISCITITLILLGFSMILSFNVNNFTKEIEKDLNIVVFLDRKIESDDIEDVKTQINEINNVEDVIFNSKKSVKEEMQKESEVFNFEKIHLFDFFNPQGILSDSVKTYLPQTIQITRQYALIHLNKIYFNTFL